MISLIKAGAFDEMMDRKLCMGWYIWETCDKKKRITLQNMASLMKYQMIPEDTEEQVMARRVYEFNRYLKAVCKASSEYYKLDERAINFLIEIEKEDLILEVATALKDVFVAQIETTQQEIIMRFSNGQKFVLSVN
jgi:hypothetical protein